MLEELPQANLFELSGGDIQVTYSSLGIDGSRLLSYLDGNTNSEQKINSAGSTNSEGQSPP